MPRSYPTLSACGTPGSTGPRLHQRHLAHEIESVVLDLVGDGPFAGAHVLDRERVLTPSTRSKSMTTSRPPARSASWSDSEHRARILEVMVGVAHEGEVDRIRRESRRLRVAENGRDVGHTLLLRDFFDVGEELGRDVLGEDAASAPTSAAMSSVRKPVPAPTSATSMPGAKPSVATMACGT